MSRSKSEEPPVRCAIARLAKIASFLFIAAAAPSEAGAQHKTGYFIGQSLSWGSSAFVFCDPSGCVDAVERSNRPLRSLAVGVDRRIRERDYYHVSLGASLSRRGWWDGDWTSLTTLSLPLMGVVEPFGPDAVLGVSAGAGVSGDIAVDRLRESRLSVTGGLWVHTRVASRLRLVLGVRGSRAIRKIDGLYLRSHVISIGLSAR